MVMVQAVVIPEPHKVGLQEVSLREPQANEVVIETAYTSISAGTERMLLAGQMPHPMLQLPVVPGYETVGHVISAGADVSQDLVGTAVYVGGAHCYEHVNPAWGGQSAQLIAAADKIVPLNGINPRHGVLLALSATALHGVDVLNPSANDRMLVIGQGPVGQLAARLTQNRDAWVAVSDLNPQRLQHAVADEIINVSETDLSDVITEPVNAIIEASGSMQALTAALPHLANGGTIILLGYYSNLDLPYMPLFLKEAKILTAKEWGANDLARSRDMIADGSLDVASLLTHELPVRDVTNGYEIAMNDQSCLKLVLDWSEL